MLPGRTLSWPASDRIESGKCPLDEVGRLREFIDAGQRSNLERVLNCRNRADHCLTRSAQTRNRPEIRPSSFGFRFGDFACEQ